MLGSAQGVRIGITGLGVHVPDKVLTNAELAEIVETTDEWIRERTGIRERRIAADDEALTDIALPAARAAIDDAGVDAADIDFLDLRHRDPGHDVPDVLRAPRGRARDAASGRVRPPRRVYGLRLRHRAGVRDARLGAVAARPRRRRRRALEDPRLGGPLDTRSLRRRRRCSGDGAGRAGRFPRLRARRRRRRGRVPAGTRDRARDTSRIRTRSSR